MDLNAIEISSQAATAFAAQTRPNCPAFPQLLFPSTPSYCQPSNLQNAPRMYQRPFYHCNNCRKEGHSASRCFAPGGGLAGQSPWKPLQGQSSSQFPARTHNNSTFVPPQQPNITTKTITKWESSAHLASQPSKDMVMMANIIGMTEETTVKVTLSTPTTALSTIENKSHIWLVDSAASSHICGNIDLFHALYTVAPVTIETVSGESFMANQRGTIHITLCSDPHFDIPNLQITLLEVIYVPKLNVNLLSVCRMTNADVYVIFGKHHSTLSKDNIILACRSKMGNLFTYMALSIPAPTGEGTL